MDLKRRTLDGLAWIFLARLVNQVVQYGISVVVARVLMPDDFGLVAMVGAVTGVAAIFLDLGIGAAIIQRRDLTEEQTRAAFFATSGLGLLLCLITVAAAPLVASFYGRADLESITRVMALTFVFNAAGVVPRSLLQRELRLKRSALNDVVAGACGAVVNLVLALRGFHVWSLVASTIVSGIVGSTLAWIAAGRLRPSTHLSSITPLLHVSFNLLAFNFVNYWARAADNLIIGKMLGERELGIYTRAYSLMMLAISQIAATVSGGMVPALAQAQGDEPRLRRMYLRAVSMTAFVAFPLMVGLSASADAFMRTIYGHKWVDAIPILRLLALVGALQAFLNPVGWIFVSQGRTDRLLRIGLITAPVIVIGFFVGATFRSARAVAWSYVITNLLICIPEMKVAGDCIGLSVREMLSSLKKTALSAAIMGALVWAVGWLTLGLPNPVRLGAQVVTGVITFLGMATLLKDPALLDAKEIFGERWARLKLKLGRGGAARAA